MENIEDQKRASVWKPAFQYGVLAGIILIVIAIVYYVAGQQQHWSSGIISYLALLVVIIYGLKTYRDELLDGYIKYGRALGFGVLVSLFAGIVSGLYTFALFKFINPDALQTLLIDAEQKIIEASPGISDRELDMALSFTRFFINPYFFFISSLFSTTFFGTIFSLIAAAVFKKEKPSEMVE